MLATYAAIDPRVQYLGYTMKVFAKVIQKEGTYLYNTVFSDTATEFAFSNTNWKGDVRMLLT